MLVRASSLFSAQKTREVPLTSNFVSRRVKFERGRNRCKKAESSALTKVEETLSNFPLADYAQLKLDGSQHLNDRAYLNSK